MARELNLAALAMVATLCAAHARASAVQSDLHESLLRLRKSYGWVEKARISGRCTETVTMQSPPRTRLTETRFEQETWLNQAHAKAEALVQPFATAAATKPASERWLYEWLARDERLYVLQGRDGEFEQVLVFGQFDPNTLRFIGSAIVNAPLLGRSWMDGGRAFEELVWESTATVRTEPAAYRNTDCIVIQARGRRGDLDLWIAPAFGNIIVKYNIEKREDDLFYDEPVRDSVLEAGKRLRLVRDELDDVVVQKYGETWVAVSGVEKITATYEDGSVSESTRRMLLTDVRINSSPPTTSFVLRAANGTPVAHLDQPASGVAEEWYDNQVRKVVDAEAMEQLSKAVATAEEVRGADARPALISLWWARALLACAAALMVWLTIIFARKARRGTI